MAQYEIAVLGTGPAGLSAAVTAKLRGKNVVLLGSATLSEKLEKAHAIQNYLGLPNISGRELAAAFRRHLDEMGLSVTEKRVTTVYAMGNGFSLQTSDGDMLEADTVILATGVTPGRTYPGETAFLGRGVSYCATCDAPLYKGKRVAVIGGSPREEAEVDYLAQVAESVRYLPLYPEKPRLTAAVEIVYEKPMEILGGMKAEQLRTDKGLYDVDGVFILRESVAPGQLVPGLALSGSAVAVDRQMATNLPGCFACGDVTGTPYQYIKAAGEGNVAALSAVAFLDHQKRG